MHAEDVIEDQLYLPKSLQKGTISVTNLVSIIWCSRKKQFELEQKTRIENRRMKKGTAFHDALEDKDHRVIKLKVSNREEYYAAMFLNGISMLLKIKTTGYCRELWVFGVVATVMQRDTCRWTHEMKKQMPMTLIINGVIDDVSIEDGYIHLKDNKTRAKKGLPSESQQKGTAFQLSIYHLILSALRNIEFDHNLAIQAVLQGQTQQGRLGIIMNIFSELAKCSLFKSLGKGIESFKEEIYNLILEDVPDLYSEEVLKSLMSTVSGLLVIYCTLVKSIAPLLDKVSVKYEAPCGWQVTDTKSVIDRDEIDQSISRCIRWWCGFTPSEYISKEDSFKCKFCDFVYKCPGTPLSFEDIENCTYSQIVQSHAERLHNKFEELAKLPCEELNEIIPKLDHELKNQLLIFANHALKPSEPVIEEEIKVEPPKLKYVTAKVEW